MLTEYSLEQSNEWDEIVKSFKSYDTYWLSGYTRAFKVHGDGEPRLFYYEDNNIRGINVCMKRDVAKDPHFQGKITENEYFDLATPYGYGGWLIECVGADESIQTLPSKRLFEEYEQYCKKTGYISEFVRFHPVLKNHTNCIDSYEVVGLGNTVTMDISSPEIIWKNLTSKNRNHIRKAEKNGVKINHGNDSEIFSTFREIYNATMDKDEAEKYYYFDESFYESLRVDLPNNVEVFYAVFEEKIIGASIILFEGERMNYHLSGSLREYSSLAATNLLLYQAALWGCECGCKTFYLGGGVGSGEDSLFKFKKSFYRADDLNRFYIGKKVFDIRKYDSLIRTRGNINTKFFPEYRG